MTNLIPILNYHAIDGSGAPGFRRWVVDPGLFAQHLRAITDEGYTGLTVSEMLERRDGGTLPDRPVVLTFDDGFCDFAEHAVPVLEQFGCPATLYVCTGWVGGTSRWLEREGEGNRRMLSWHELASLPRSVEIGSHTRTHPQLDTVGREAAREEITGSRGDLERNLQRTVRSFAYPHGYHSARVRDLVVRAGYTSACAVKDALSVPTDDRFALARLIVNADTDAATLVRWMRGDGRSTVRHGQRVATVGWRVVRRARAQLAQGRR